MQYLGFDVNGEECERFLGEAFESHLPSRDEIAVRTPSGEVVASVGDWLVRHGATVRVAPGGES
jgi:hypothetical protein